MFPRLHIDIMKQECFYTNFWQDYCFLIDTFSLINFVSNMNLKRINEKEVRVL